MNSEFGLMHLWAQGDIVTRIVFVILASMSVLSWCVIIIKGLGILRVQGQARKVPGFWHNADLDAALGSLGSGGLLVCSCAARRPPARACPRLARRLARR